MAREMGCASLNLRPSCDRRGLRKIKTEIVISIDAGLAEILHFPFGLQPRSPGSHAERPHLKLVSADAEMRFRVPGKGAVPAKRTVRLPQNQVAFVTAAEQRVAHVARNFTQREIERNFSISQNGFTPAHFKATDGEGKKLLH